MKLIVGLGNPGEKYKNTRHNVGFMMVDKLRIILNGNDWQEEVKFRSLVSKITNPDILFCEPMTFMNESGDAVSKIASFYKIKADDIYIIHDDLDIKLKEYKIQKGIGPQLHYGIKSVEDKLGRGDFWRVRMGVDNRSPDDRIPGEEYVLQNFNSDELEEINETFEKALMELKGLISV